MWHKWWLFAASIALEFAVVGLLSASAVPDFGSISQYRVDLPGAGATRDIVVNTRLQRPSSQMLYVPTYGGSLSVEIDGHPAQSVHPQDDVQLTRSRHVAMLPLAADRFTAGANTIIIRQSGAYAGVALKPVYLGPIAAIGRVAEQHRYWGWLMQQLIPAAGMFTVLLSTLLIFFSRNPLKYFFLILAFALQTVLELDDQITIAGHSMREFGIEVGMTVQFFIAMAVVVWTGATPGRRRLVLISSGVMMTIVVISQLAGLAENASAYRFVMVAYGLYIAVLNLYNWRMISAVPQSAVMRQAAIPAIFILSMSGIFTYVALFYDGYPVVLTFFLSNWVNIASSMAVTIFIVGALANEVLTYRTDNRRLGTLRQLVAGHHIEDDAQAQTLRHEIELRAVLEERQRFVRDMHDGIGGQLLGVLMKVRAGNTPAQELALDVQSAIAELRLITSAMDSESPGLAGALIGLHGRFKSQTDAAGMELEWSVPQVSQFSKISSRDIVEVLRIVQEAVANAIRHANAQTVSIAAELDGQLRISISDDGCGFDHACTPAGQGLRNMRRRAEKLGGSLAIDSQPGAGTKLVLSVKGQS